MNRRAVVQVPATSANLGPGFDVLGLAIQLYNDVVFECDGRWSKRKSLESLSMEALGEGAAEVPGDETNVIIQAAFRVFERAKKWPVHLSAQMVNRIPLSRGLGSSSAAIVGGLFAANRLAGSPLSAEELIQMAVEMEGHPDNVVPAAAGGLCVSAMVEGRAEFLKFATPAGLAAVVCIPEIPLSTSKARSVLPKSVPFKDAVFTSSRVGLLISALLQKRYDLLAFAMDDVLHQPPRARLLPGLLDVIGAARKAGAYGAALSGAGSTMIAFAKPGAGRRIGPAMQRAFKRRKIASRWQELRFDNRGVLVR